MFLCMWAPRFWLQVALALALLASPALATEATARAPLPRPVVHDLDRTQVRVVFHPDHTFQIDVSNPPDWLLKQLEPLSESPSSTLLEGAARDRRLAELTGVFADWVWLLFDGERVGVDEVEYVPALPPGPDDDPNRPPLATMRLFGTVPDGAKTFSFAYGIAVDPYPTVVTAGDGTEATHWVSGPVESEGFDIDSLTPPSRWDVILQYLILGYQHILPKGVDHILFVIGIYLLSTRLRPILAQVTAFTVAHTITLGLTIFGVISLPSHVVEPMIALSIAYVAVENLFTSDLHAWRIGLVFSFGLLHGMGFAGVLRDLGLPPSERVPALLSFNLGVEGGQLTVILGMFLMLGWLRRNEGYRRWAVMPISCAIAVVGLYWTVTRITGG